MVITKSSECVRVIGIHFCLLVLLRYGIRFVLSPVTDVEPLRPSKVECLSFVACSVVVHDCVLSVISLGIFEASSSDLAIMVVSSRDTRVESLLNRR